MNDAAKEAFKEWWGAQTLKGDPIRRPNLVGEAFAAGFAAAGAKIRQQVEELDLLTSERFR